MLDELKSIAIFAETVNQGSFRKAATSLGLSPSVVSYHIAQLESHIGNALLYRSTRKLSLTNEGETLYKHAVTMLTAAKSGLDELSFNNSNPSGKLSITIPEFLSQSTITERISNFCQNYPDVLINIRCTDERLNIIQDGIDIAIRVGDMKDSEIKSKFISSIKRKLVCSPFYLEKTNIRYPDDLSQADWISLSMLPNKRVISKESQFTISYTRKITVNSVTLMTELCVHGLGLATPPDFLVERYIKEGALIEILPDWSVESIPIYAVWPKNVNINSNVMNFIKFIAAPDKHLTKT